MTSILVAMTVLLIPILASAEIVTTTDGRQIELRDDGTYEILPSDGGRDYKPLDVEEFRVFREAFVGEKVSASVTGALSRRDAERGVTMVNLGGKTSLWVRAEISGLSRADLVKLSGCQNCRYRLFGAVKKVGTSIGLEAHKVTILGRN